MGRQSRCAQVTGRVQGLREDAHMGFDAANAARNPPDARFRPQLSSRSRPRAPGAHPSSEGFKNCEGSTPSGALPSGPGGGSDISAWTKDHRPGARHEQRHRFSDKDNHRRAQRAHVPGSGRRCACPTASPSSSPPLGEPGLCGLPAPHLLPARCARPSWISAFPPSIARSASSSGTASRAGKRPAFPSRPGSPTG